MIEERKKRRLIKGMHLSHDLSVTILAFIASYFIRRYIGYMSINPNYYIVLLLVIIIWFSIIYLFNPYSFFALKKFSQIVKDTIKITGFSMITLVAFLYLFKMKDVSRIMLGIFYIIDLSILLVNKRLIFFLMHKYNKRELNIYNVLIIGSKERAVNAIKLIESSKEGQNIIGCLEIEKTKKGKTVKDKIKVIGTMDDLEDVILHNVVDEVIFAMPLKEIDYINVYMLLIESVGIKVRIIPDWHIYAVLYQPEIAEIAFEDFYGLPTMVLNATSPKHRDILIKYSIDYTVAFFAMLLFFPLFFIIGLMIKIFSWGPVLFKQERVGLNGRKFNLYKFRTMVPNAEEMLEELMELNEADGPVFKIKKDPRIIPFIGTILRKTSLDELPQIINILRGEMSIVGPRPPIQSEVDQYDIWQRRRLSMKPGLTCLWQISPNRNDISFEEWMKLDLQYIDEWSMDLDFSIMLKTVMVVLFGHGR